MDQEQPQKPSLVTRTAIFIGKALLCVWVLNVLFLFFSKDFLPHLNVDNAFPARLYESVRIGFVQIPDTIVYFVGLIWSVAEPIFRDIEQDLGRPILPSGRVDSAPIISAPDFSSYGYFLLRIAGFFSVIQFAMFFLIMAFGGKVEQQTPIGFPSITPARSVLAFWSVSLFFAYLLCQSSFGIGFFSGVVTFVIVIALMRYPIAATLPLWFGENILGLHPRMVAALPNYVIEAIGPLPDLFPKRTGKKVVDTEKPRKDHSAQDGPSAKREDAGSDGARSKDAPPPDTGRASYEYSCNLLKLEPDKFDQAALRRRFREFMKKTHPDQGGSTPIAQMVQDAYENILRYHGWRR